MVQLIFPLEIILLLRKVGEIVPWVFKSHIRECSVGIIILMRIHRLAFALKRGLPPGNNYYGYLKWWWEGKGGEHLSVTYFHSYTYLHALG